MSSKPIAGEDQSFLEYSDENSADELKHNHQYRRSEKSYSRFLSHFILLLITSIFWIMVLSDSSPSSKQGSKPGPGSPRYNITTNAHLLSCGNTTVSARAQGCKFDILLNHWVPAPCYDASFVADYLDDDSWTAYADQNMTQKIETIDEISEMEVYYTSVRDHSNHCGTMWKKQFWALYEEKRELDTLIASPGHTDHCAYYLMGVAVKNETEATRVEVGFAGCWIRD